MNASPASNGNETKTGFHVQLNAITLMAVSCVNAAR